MQLENKTVLVTAATRGIGLACVKACAAEGAQVYLAARNVPRALEIAKEIPGTVRCVYCDADQPESFSTMVEDVMADAGHLDVLVNNFGASDPKKDLDILHTEPAVFLDTVCKNLGSVFRASQAAAKYMCDRGGSIVNISSVGGSVPDVSQIGYGTGKAAINHLTKILAVQLAHRKIRCNAVLPGMTATQSVEQRLTAQFRENFLRHVPLGRMGIPEEIAAAVVYFASEASAYTTGQILTVSGGFGLATPIYGDWKAGMRRDLEN